MRRKRLTEADLAALTRQIAVDWRAVATPADARKSGIAAWDAIDTLPPSWVLVDGQAMRKRDIA